RQFKFAGSTRNSENSKPKNRNRVRAVDLGYTGKVVNNQSTGKEARMSKVSVVTGGASGIGRAVVERLAKDNFITVILDIDEVSGKEVSTEIRGRGQNAQFVRLDVTEESAVRESFQKIISDHGRVDALVNVAGGTTHWHTIEEFALNHWRETIDLNLTSTFLCCREVIGVMKRQKSGAIINTFSDLGFTGGLRRAAYSTAKAGIVGFFKCLALELAPFGGFVNCGAPGRVETQGVRSRY